MTTCLDVSNYSSPFGVEKVREWQAAGIQLVIIQAFPPSYHQWAEQVQQVEACHEAGMPWDGYIYDYLGDPSWRDSALFGLTQLRQQGRTARQVWMDEEDVETERGWPIPWRQDAVRASVAAVRASAFIPGIYTAAWWWMPYMGNTAAFSHLELWDSDFDGLADAEQSWRPYGGWTHRRIKQHVGSTSFLGVSGVDLNVLSMEEAAELEPADPRDEQIAGLLGAVSYMADDLGDRLLEVQRELQRVREQFVGPRA